MNHGQAAPPGGRPRSWLRLKPVTAIVLLLSLIGTGVVTAVLHRVADDQEQRLLEERTDEVVALFRNAITSLESSLGGIGAAASLSPPSPEAFRSVATAHLTRNPTVIYLAHVRPSGSDFVIADVVGKGAAKGDVLTGDPAATLRRANATGKLASTGVLKGEGKRVGLAFRASTTGPPVLLYQEVLLGGPSSDSQDGPFSELDIAIFAIDKADPDNLLGSSTDAPLTGDVATQRIAVGDDGWLLQVSAKDPLIGSLANAVPWLALVGGLLGCVLIAAAIEAVLRRRDYALELVDERTQQLRLSLADLEEAQSQLVRQERLAAVGQLASTVGHELRNPLGVITNALFVVRMATAEVSDDRLDRNLAIAEREVGAATLIVSDLLEYARGRTPLLAPVDLLSLTQEALEVAAPPVGITARIEGGAGLPDVSCDRDLLRQVLLNLLSNAYDASETGSEVVVSLAAAGSHVTVTVRDDGVGMDEDTLARVFQPFFTTKARGTGLGLAVAERVVLAHEGSLTVTSAPGRGTTFVVSVPVEQTSAESTV